MIKFTDPWGWSKLDVWRHCKAEFKFQFIDKKPQPGNKAMNRGQDMHETIEAYLQGWISELPVELIDWKLRFDELRTKTFTAEQAIGLDRQWLPLPDWFHKDTWLRAKMDAKYLEEKILTIIDFKSGKYRVPSDDQIELYALVGYAQHPEVEEVVTEFWFIDQNDSYSRKYTAEELKMLRPKYEDFARRIYDTEVWIEEPSRDCKFCNYSRTRGGPCKY